MPPALSPATQTFGARVREHRRRRGLSQEALAEVAGLHWTFVGQVERGLRNLSLHNVLRIAAALETDAGTLVAGLRAPVQSAASGVTVDQ